MYFIYVITSPYTGGAQRIICRVSGTETCHRISGRTLESYGFQQNTCLAKLGTGKEPRSVFAASRFPSKSYQKFFPAHRSTTVVAENMRSAQSRAGRRRNLELTISGGLLSVAQARHA